MVFINQKFQNTEDYTLTCTLIQRKKVIRFCVEGLPKILDFDYFVLNRWQTDQKQEIMNQSCKDLFIWTELPIV